MIDKLAYKLADYVVANDPEADREMLAYGFDLFLQEAVTVALAVLIALPLGIPIEVLLAYAVYQFMRRHAGGPHAKSHLGCVVTSLVILFGPGLIVTQLALRLPILAMPFFYGVDLTMIILYAPGDTDVMPIEGADKRRRLRRLAGIELTVLFGISLLCWSWFPGWSQVIVWVATIVCLLLHPWGYKIFGCRRSAFEAAGH